MCNSLSYVVVLRFHSEGLGALVLPNFGSVVPRYRKYSVCFLFCVMCSSLSYVVVLRFHSQGLGALVLPRLWFSSSSVS